MGRDPIWGRLAKFWGREILMSCSTELLSSSYCLAGQSGSGMSCSLLSKNLKKGYLN